MGKLSERPNHESPEKDFLPKVVLAATDQEIDDCLSFESIYLGKEGEDIKKRVKSKINLLKADNLFDTYFFLYV